MSLANQQDFAGAARIVAAVYEKSGDPGVGFTLVQLLEQSVASLPPCDPRRLETSSRCTETARRLLESGQLPELFAQQLPDVFWHGAVALAEAGCPERCTAALDEAFRKGFDGFDEALSQPAMQRTLGAERLDELVSTARLQSSERAAGDSRLALQQFQPFPFALDTIDVDAAPLSLVQSSGKVVIVCFWGSWCPACQRNLRAVESLAEQLPDDLDVIVLAFENGDAEAGTAAARRALGEAASNVRVALADPALTGQVPAFAGFPTMLFLDRNGAVRLALAGPVGQQKLQAVVELLRDE